MQKCKCKVEIHYCLKLWILSLFYLFFNLFYRELPWTPWNWKTFSFLRKPRYELCASSHALFLYLLGLFPHKTVLCQSTHRDDVGYLTFVLNNAGHAKRNQTKYSCMLLNIKRCHNIFVHRLLIWSSFLSGSDLFHWVQYVLTVKDSISVMTKYR